MAEKEAGVEAVERALSLLQAFGENDTSLTLAELARRTGLYKSTILRLAASLGRYRYLTRDERGSFRLGPELWRLGSLYRRGFELGEFIRPELRELVAVTQETASFYIREGSERVCLYRLNSPRAVRHHLDEGVRLPLDRGAAGQILLAFSGAPGERFESIRSDGFYVSLGERDPEVGAVAAPVFDAAGAYKGALSLSSLLTRFDGNARNQAIEAVLEGCRRLRERLPVNSPHTDDVGQLR